MTSLPRRFRSHEESYDYYYGPRGGRGADGGGKKRRIAPPPPPGFGDGDEGGKGRRAKGGRAESSGEETEEGEEEEGEDGPEVFRNFKVICTSTSTCILFSGNYQECRRRHPEPL